MVLKDLPCLTFIHTYFERCYILWQFMFHSISSIQYDISFGGPTKVQLALVGPEEDDVATCGTLVLDDGGL